jgi:hypothetical protein
MSLSLFSLHIHVLRYTAAGESLNHEQKQFAVRRWVMKAVTVSFHPLLMMRVIRGDWLPLFFKVS